MYPSFTKRAIDVIFSLIGIVIFSPLIIVIILILCIEHKGKPFFLQHRAGLNCHSFKIFKLKTLRDITNEDGSELSLEDRVTPFGKFLRKYSLDELPQLANVLIGDMSLVGPRPFLSEYVGKYSKDQLKRHKVLPGITGWAQVNGRNNISWEKKIKLDLWYVRNLSLRTDVYILLKTIREVLIFDSSQDSTCLDVPVFKNANVE